MSSPSVSRGGQRQYAVSRARTHLSRRARRRSSGRLETSPHSVAIVISSSYCPSSAPRSGTNQLTQGAAPLVPSSGNPCGRSCCNTVVGRSYTSPAKQLNSLARRWTWPRLTRAYRFHPGMTINLVVRWEAYRSVGCRPSVVDGPDQGTLPCFTGQRTSEKREAVLNTDWLNSCLACALWLRLCKASAFRDGCAGAAHNVFIHLGKCAASDLGIRPCRCHIGVGSQSSNDGYKTKRGKVSA